MAKYSIITNPTKKQLIVLTIIGVFTIVGYLLSMTSFFTRSAFTKANLVFWFSILLCVAVMSAAYVNYFKANKNL